MSLALLDTVTPLATISGGTSTRLGSSAISTTTSRRRTTVRQIALWGYDYAGQDPIDNYDLSGEAFIADSAVSGARKMSKPAAAALERAIAQSDAAYRKASASLIDVNITVSLGIGFTAGLQVGTNGQASVYGGEASGVSAGVSAVVQPGNPYATGQHNTVSAAVCDTGCVTVSSDLRSKGVGGNGGVGVGVGEKVGLTQNNFWAWRLPF